MSETVFSLPADRAVVAAGGAIALASALGVSHQAVYRWQRDGYLPLARALEVDAMLGIPYRSLLEPGLAAAMQEADARTEAESLL